MADPCRVSQTFFVDEEIKAAMRLDGIITVVDAQHLEQHIDSSEEVREQCESKSPLPMSFCSIKPI